MGDWLDKFLAFGESFDWVTPLVDLAKDVTNDYEEFTVSRSKSVNSVKRELNRSGVSVWGIEYQNDTFTFRVKRGDAPKVRGLL